MKIHPTRARLLHVDGQTWQNYWSLFTILWMRLQMFQTKSVKKIKTHVLCSIDFFFSKIIPFMRQVEKYGTARQATDDNTTHKRCGLTKAWIHTHTHTHNISYFLLLWEVQTFLSGWQCNENHLLHFHGKNKHFYIVDRHMYYNNKKGMHCCSSMATMVAQMCHNVMLYIHCLS
jgi:hypothetical protein